MFVCVSNNRADAVDRLLIPRTTNWTKFAHSENVSKSYNQDVIQKMFLSCNQDITLFPATHIFIDGDHASPGHFAA